MTAAPARPRPTCPCRRTNPFLAVVVPHRSAPLSRRYAPRCPRHEPPWSCRSMRRPYCKCWCRRFSRRVAGPDSSSPLAPVRADFEIPPRPLWPLRPLRSPSRRLRRTSLAVQFDQRRVGVASPGPPRRCKSMQHSRAHGRWCRPAGLHGRQCQAARSSAVTSPPLSLSTRPWRQLPRFLLPAIGGLSRINSCGVWRGLLGLFCPAAGASRAQRRGRSHSPRRRRRAYSSYTIGQDSRAWVAPDAMPPPRARLCARHDQWSPRQTAIGSPPSARCAVEVVLFIPKCPWACGA